LPAESVQKCDFNAKLPSRQLCIKAKFKLLASNKLQTVTSHAHTFRGLALGAWWKDREVMASEAEASPSEVVEQSAELQIMDNVEPPTESLDWSSLLKNLKTSELQRKKERLAAAESMISQHNVASEDLFSDSHQGSIQHPVADPLLEAAHCGSHGRTIETRHATLNSTQWLWAALFSILLSTLLVGLGVASLAVYWEEHEGLHFWQTTPISGHDERAGCKVLSKGNMIV
jgi:hypothetical protein